MFWTPLLTVFNGVPLYTKGVTFLLKMEYKSVRGWTSGRSLPNKTLLITLPIRGGLEPLRPCRSLSARICTTKLFASRKVRSEFDFFKMVFFVVYLKKCFQLKGKSSDKQLLSIDYSLGVYTVISSLIGSSRAVESAHPVILASHACLRMMHAGDQIDNPDKRSGIQKVSK